MLTKRLIACFDVIKGNVTKAQKFEDNIFIDSAEVLAKRMYSEQIDEIIFYDITASSEKRKIDIETVRKVAKNVFVPFTVGGGIKAIDDMYQVLKAGAEKVSIDSMAVRNPNIIQMGALAFGSQCIVLSMQVKRVRKTEIIPSGYEIAIDGAKIFTGLDAVEWARRGEALGAGEIVVNSIDKDGTHSGYDVEITSLIRKAVNIPVVASGGAGNLRDIINVFEQANASAAIISSILYSPRITKNLTVREIKQQLRVQGIPIRPWIPSEN
ncbi:imidazole glycerol phosphate synthase cyclase subunit [Plectonema radiosum NIES-515]|uniref:imidazole glycerol-phosphate synthase n=1 Tax=Plectonema radiosum NIES-515 TaxID=2986073 RepID=A0ABT3AXE3_9CYAN|nr:imidazole glycerol phosphate synthase cyclase subunit [Plectonema radiosum]MCV3213797.1 imidazole glycerol phosphate synthase cyclase subunit [Plectonema radiosum NIES-515]